MIDVLDVLGPILAGWRFLLSPRFRAAKEREWRAMRRMEVMEEVIAGIAGVVLPALLVVCVWWQLR